MTFVDTTTGMSVTAWLRQGDMWTWQVTLDDRVAFFDVPWDFPEWAMFAAGRRALGLPLSGNARDVLELAGKSSPNRGDGTRRTKTGGQP